MDVTLIRLLDGTRLYLHAVIDNYSRKLLAWELANKLDPTNTCRMLETAGRHLVGVVPTVMADSGVENVNNQVDELLDTGKLRRVLAQVEVSYSNSMIEAWWRCLKHSWLYLHSLDSAAAVERLVAFYVEQHNTVMPHRAFDGRTPDEVYFGVADNLAGELAERRRLAREQRVASNRSKTCATCEPRGTATEAVPREAA
jgi:transposase InsO family protein